MTTISALALGQARIAPAPAALQGALERLQQRLSDCVNCASAGTAQGKADIAAVETQIGLVKQRLAEPAAPANAIAPVRDTPPGTRIDVYA